MNCAPLSQEASQEILVLENALMHIHTACSLDVSGGGVVHFVPRVCVLQLGGGGLVYVVVLVDEGVHVLRGTG